MGSEAGVENYNGELYVPASSQITSVSQTDSSRAGH